MKDPKKLNPYTRRNVVQTRVDSEEFREILTKAKVYTNGDVSKFVRLAVMEYKPLKRVAK